VWASHSHSQQPQPQGGTALHCCTVGLAIIHSFILYTRCTAAQLIMFPCNSLLLLLFVAWINIIASYPLARLSLPAHISSCVGIIADASDSRGEELIYEWNVTSNNSSHVNAVNTINQRLSQLPQFSPIIELDLLSDLSSVTGFIEINLTVTDLYNHSDSIQGNLLIPALVLYRPVVSIIPLVLSGVSSYSIFAASALLPSCVEYPSNSFLSYQWAIQPSLNVPNLYVQGKELILPSNCLLVNVSYVISVTVKPILGWPKPFGSSTANYQLFIQSKPPQAIILGAPYMSIDTSDHIVLNGSLSFSRNSPESALSYNWTCSRLLLSNFTAISSQPLVNSLTSGTIFSDYSYVPCNLSQTLLSNSRNLLLPSTSLQLNNYYIFTLRVWNSNEVLTTVIDNSYNTTELVNSTVTSYEYVNATTCGYIDANDTILDCYEYLKLIAVNTTVEVNHTYTINSQTIISQPTQFTDATLLLSTIPANNNNLAVFIDQSLDLANHLATFQAILMNNQANSAAFPVDSTTLYIWQITAIQNSSIILAQFHVNQLKFAIHSLSCGSTYRISVDLPSSSLSSSSLYYNPCPPQLTRSTASLLLAPLNASNLYQLTVFGYDDATDRLTYNFLYQTEQRGKELIAITSQPISVPRVTALFPADNINIIVIVTNQYGLSVNSSLQFAPSQLSLPAAYCSYLNSYTSLQTQYSQTSDLRGILQFMSTAAINLRLDEISVSASIADQINPYQVFLSSAMHVCSLNDSNSLVAAQLKLSWLLFLHESLTYLNSGVYYSNNLFNSYTVDVNSFARLLYYLSTNTQQSAAITAAANSVANDIISSYNLATTLAAEGVNYLQSYYGSAAAMDCSNYESNVIPPALHDLITAQLNQQPHSIINLATAAYSIIAQRLNSTQCTQTQLYAFPAAPHSFYSTVVTLYPLPFSSVDIHIIQYSSALRSCLTNGLTSTRHNSFTPNPYLYSDIIEVAIVAQGSLLFSNSSSYSISTGISNSPRRLAASSVHLCSSSEDLQGVGELSCQQYNREMESWSREHCQLTSQSTPPITYLPSYQQLYYSSCHCSSGGETSVIYSSPYLQPCPNSKAGQQALFSFFFAIFASCGFILLAQLGRVFIAQRCRFRLTNVVVVVHFTLAILCVCRCIILVARAFPDTSYFNINSFSAESVGILLCAPYALVYTCWAMTAYFWSGLYYYTTKQSREPLKPLYRGLTLTNAAQYIALIILIIINQSNAGNSSQLVFVILSIQIGLLIISMVIYALSSLSAAIHFRRRARDINLGADGLLDFQVSIETQLEQIKQFQLLYMQMTIFCLLIVTVAILDWFTARQFQLNYYGDIALLSIIQYIIELFAYSLVIWMFRVAVAELSDTDTDNTINNLHKKVKQNIQLNITSAVEEFTQESQPIAAAQQDSSSTNDNLALQLSNCGLAAEEIELTHALPTIDPNKIIARETSQQSSPHPIASPHTPNNRSSLNIAAAASPNSARRRSFSLAATSPSGRRSSVSRANPSFLMAVYGSDLASQPEFSKSAIAQSAEHNTNKHRQSASSDASAPISNSPLVKPNISLDGEISSNNEVNPAAIPLPPRTSSISSAAPPPNRLASPSLIAITENEIESRSRAATIEIKGNQHIINNNSILSSIQSINTANNNNSIDNPESYVCVAGAVPFLRPQSVNLFEDDEEQAQ
jgi:hypothetical protein